MYSVEAVSLTKIYTGNFGKRKVTALDDFSINVEKGNIFGLLGPNGAGKTTFIKILLGITHKTNGNASILGSDISNFKIKNKVGYLPENHKYPLYLNGEQVLRFFGQLSHYDEKYLSKRIDFLLEIVKLNQWRKMKIKTYSKGMMQRLGLAQALINDPELLILDEPTDGVDPIGRKEIRNILLEQKELGKTIFVNSHLLSEVELISDKVAILNKGKLLRQGTVKELTEVTEQFNFILDGGSDKLPSILENKFGFTKKEQDSFIINLKDINELNQAIDLLRAGSVQIKAIIPMKNSLEDYFINLISQTETYGKQI